MAILLVLIAYTLGSFNVEISFIGDVYGWMQHVLFFLWCGFLIGVLKPVLFNRNHISKTKELSVVMTVCIVYSGMLTHRKMTHHSSMMIQVCTEDFNALRRECCTIIPVC